MVAQGVVVSLRSGFHFCKTEIVLCEDCVISAGANDGKYIEVLSGLSEGDTVVTEIFEGIDDDDVRVEVAVEKEGKGKKQKGGER